MRAHFGALTSAAAEESADCHQGLAYGAHWPLCHGLSEQTTGIVPLPAAVLPVPERRQWTADSGQWAAETVDTGQVTADAGQ